MRQRFAGRFRFLLSYALLNSGGLHSRIGKREMHFWHNPANFTPFTKAQAVHDASGVIGIVSDAEPGKNPLGETGCGPAFRVEVRGPRTRLVHFREGFELIGGKAAGPAGRAALLQCLDSVSAQRAVPSGRRGAADPEFAGDLGLRESRLQVLCGQQAPALHFIASETTEF